MARKIKGLTRITAAGTIAEWKITADKRDLKLAGLLFHEADLATLSDWIAEGELVTIRIAPVDSKLGLSPIAGAGKLTGLDMRADDHRPKFKDLVFTELDPAELAGLISSETRITVTLMLVQNRLTVTDDGDNDGLDAIERIALGGETVYRRASDVGGGSAG